MKVLFLHGLESKPGGSKSIYLQDKGHEVLNPALPKSSFPKSIQIAQEQIDNEKPDVIVGSSRGGAIAMAVNPRGARLVLVAPAWKNFNVKPSVPSGTIILHSPSDEIIPFADSRKIEGASAVVPVGDGHRMFDEEALAAIEKAVQGGF
jgi:hypothetical protein